MKRVALSVVLVLMVISSCLFFMRQKPVHAITQFTVEITPSVTNTIADFTFRFSIEQPIKVHDTIKLVFPPGTTFVPPLPEEQEARKARLVQLMNCIQYIPPTESWKDPEPGIALIDYEIDGSIILTFFSHFRFNPEQEKYRNLVVNISKEAGIVTPSLSGTYRYKIATSAEPTLIESQAVELIDTSFTVQIFPPMISSIAEYEFQIPLQKPLKVHDWFCIVFPPGTTLTPPLREGETLKKLRLKDIADAFSLFGIGYEASLGLPLITFLNDGSLELKLHSPIELDPAKLENGIIRIKFSRRAGFTTPPTPGKIQFSFYTIRDLSTIRSEKVELLNLTKFRVEIYPQVAGEVAEFSFYFRFEKPIKVHDWIKIKLPPGTTLNPPLPKEEPARKERLRVISEAINFDNCCCCEYQGLPIITELADKSLEIKFNCYIDVDTDHTNYTATMIVFSKEAGIVNPSVTGSYQYYIASKYEPDYTPSQLVRIIDNITDFHVEVNPRIIGEIARFQFCYTLEKKLGVHEWIKLIFPPGTTLIPPLPNEEKARKERLKVISESIFFSFQTCGPCMGLPIIEFNEDGSMELRFNNYLVIDPTDENYQKTVFSITESAGITNPNTPGSYTFRISTQKEPKYFSSFVDIMDSRITTPEVIISNPISGEPTGIDLTFYLGPAGVMKVTEGDFMIEFPEDYIKSIQGFSGNHSEYSYDMISINKLPVLNEPVWMGSTLILPVLKNMQPNDKVLIHIEERYGIFNPLISGNYTIKINTSVEKIKVDCKPFYIISSEYSARLVIKPAKTDQNTWITLSYYNHGDKLEVEDLISITFPEGFYLPGPICCGAGVTVQGEAFIKLNFSQQTMEISCPIEINSETFIRIVIGPGTAIKTPQKPGNYAFIVAHNKSETEFRSNPVLIEEPKLEIEELTISNPHAMEKADYKIKVNFYSDSLPKFGERITFRLQFLNNPIYLDITEEIEESYTFVLENIQNPPIPGKYLLKIEYSMETAEYPKGILIIPALPKLSVQVMGGKEGKNGWYTKPPKIALECNDPDTQIFYGFDIMNIGYRYDGYPKLIDVGYYLLKIYCYVQNAYGKSRINMLEIKVDSISPEFTISNPSRQKSFSNSQIVTFSGRVEPIKFLDYNTDESKLVFDSDLTIEAKKFVKKVSVNSKDGSFSADITLEECENFVRCSLIDEAGNKSIHDVFVTVDTLPPEIKLINPKINEVQLDKTLFIEGTTEPGIRLLINDKVVYSKEDGHFSLKISLPYIGSHQVDIVAYDEMQNYSRMSFVVWFGYSIQLTIGDKQALVNDKTVNLLSPPIIDQGRTLVPFRFIGEAIGIEVGYQTDPKTKLVSKVLYISKTKRIELTIGSKVALVNGKLIEMDVPPCILHGTTLVPLRFVAENLGFDVQWDASTQTITLRYPKL